MPNVVDFDLKSKIERLAQEHASEEEERRRAIGRRAEDHLNRFTAQMAAILAIISMIVAVGGLVAKAVGV